jgi:hypothetical protein
MIKLAAPLDQSSRHSIDQSIARPTRLTAPLRDTRSGSPLRAIDAVSQARAATHGILLGISPDHGNILNLLATLDVAKRERSVHRCGLIGDCAMPKLPSL